MEKNNTDKRPLLVTMQLKVQTYDIDFMGIVSNITYIRWLEDLRLSFLETHYPLQELLKDGHVPIIQMTQINYKKPIRLFDSVTGRLWMQSFESPKWLSNMEFLVKDKVVAFCTQSGVFINLATMKPSQVPDRLLKKYNEDI